MIPLRDNIPARTPAVVNYLMIGVCTAAFLAQLAERAPEPESLVMRYGMIPARVFHPDEAITVRETVLTPYGPMIREMRFAEPPWSPWLTLLSCIFLHGGWMHFLGNMWFLHIFGDNVEDRLGHVGYLIFYLGCGVAASAAHLFANPASTLPTIGASGAIAGVMGAYMLLYPRAMVLSVIPIVFFVQMLVLPAPVFLGVWFFLQFFQGTMAITGMQTGGVAWWAHIGGFAAGFGVAALLQVVGETKPPVGKTLPYTEHVSIRRYRRL